MGKIEVTSREHLKRREKDSLDLKRQKYCRTETRPQSRTPSEDFEKAREKGRREEPPDAVADALAEMEDFNERSQIVRQGRGEVRAY